MEKLKIIRWKIIDMLNSNEAHIIRCTIETMKIHYYKNNEFSEKVFIIDIIQCFNTKRLVTEE